MRLLKYASLYSLLLTALCYGQQPTQEPAPPGIFSGYLGEAIWTLVWFFALLIVLKRLAWKPLLASLKAREEHISNEIAKAEQTNQAAHEKLIEYEEKLELLQSQNQELLERKLAEAKVKSESIIAKARQDAQEINQKAKDDITKAVEKARSQLWDDAGDIVYSLGSEILKRELTAQDNETLIEQSIQKFKEIQELEEKGD